MPSAQFTSFYHVLKSFSKSTVHFQLNKHQSAAIKFKIHVRISTLLHSASCFKETYNFLIDFSFIISLNILIIATNQQQTKFKHSQTQKIELNIFLPCLTRLLDHFNQFMKIKMTLQTHIYYRTRKP